MENLLFLGVPILKHIRVYKNVIHSDFLPCYYAFFSGSDNVLVKLMLVPDFVS